jgi:hypothetical protein
MYLTFWLILALLPDARSFRKPHTLRAHPPLLHRGTARINVIRQISDLSFRYEPSNE